MPLQEVRLGLPTPEYCARHSKKECARRPTAKLLVSCSLMDIICEQMNAANGCRMALCLNGQILVAFGARHPDKRSYDRNTFHTSSRTPGWTMNDWRLVCSTPSEPSWWERQWQ